MVERAYGRQQPRRLVGVLPLAWQRRLLEALPAVVAWTIVTSPLWLGLASPRLATLFIGVVVVFSAVRAVRFSIGALRHAPRSRQSLKTDWLARLTKSPTWPDYRVVVLIRAFREGNAAMLRSCLESIASSDWPHDASGLVHVEVVYATEEDDPITPPVVDQLAAEFRGRLVVRQIQHPYEPGVLPGPSSAMHYVGRRLYEEAVGAGWDAAKVVVADLDSDTIVHPGYLACLLTHLLDDHERERHVYQPVVLFTLDYWRAPLHSRIAAAGTSMLSMGWQDRPEIAFTGAAATLELLASVDFWPTQSHSQDSGIDLKLRMAYGDRYRTIGIPTPVRVYPVMPVQRGGGLLGTLIAYSQSLRILFRQAARWREGPLDEFLLASENYRGYHAIQRLLSGLERDTISALSMLGVPLVVGLGVAMDPSYRFEPAVALAALAMFAVTVTGGLATWALVSEQRYVGRSRSWLRRALEMVIFAIVYPIYLPLLASAPCMKTVTAYALGRRPNGHYVPTPK